LKSLIDKKIYKKFLKKGGKIYKFFSLRISNILIIDYGIKKKVVKYSYKKKIINEVKGLRYFNQNNKFNVLKILDCNIKDKPYYFVTDYIDSEKVRVKDYKRIINSSYRDKTKKVTIEKYILTAINSNDLKFNKELIKLFNKTLIYFKQNKLHNIYLNKSLSHGDFANYNVLKYRNIFYVIDFENFKFRAKFNDELNWYGHKIFYNLSKIFCFKKLLHYKVSNFILYKFTKFVNEKLSSINIKLYKIYYIFYLLEKIRILTEDVKYIKDNKEMKIVHNMINNLKNHLQYFLE